jgi:hypothetical protein
MRFLPILSNEIITQILHHLLPGDLKSVRLSSKDFAAIVEPILFSQVVLFPYTGSFEEKLALEEHPTLRHHVQCLLYDCREIRQQFVRGYRGPRRFEDTLLHKHSNQGLNVALLCRILIAFPRLTDISITNCFSGVPAELPRFFHSSPDPNEMSRNVASVSIYDPHSTASPQLLPCNNF